MLSHTAVPGPYSMHREPMCLSFYLPHPKLNEDKGRCIFVGPEAFII